MMKKEKLFKQYTIKSFNIPNRYNGWWFSICLLFEHPKAVEYSIERYNRKKSWREGIEKKKKDGWIPSGTFIYNHEIAQIFVR